MKKIIVSTLNEQMCGYHICSDWPARTTANIYQDTLAVNARAYTLKEFRKRFSISARQAMIAAYLDPDKAWYADDGSWSLRKLEKMLMRRLTKEAPSNTAFVRCNQWGDYVGPVSREEEYDLALAERVKSNEVLSDITSSGLIRYYRRKLR